MKHARKRTDKWHGTVNNNVKERRRVQLIEWFKTRNVLHSNEYKTTSFGKDLTTLAFFCTHSIWTRNEQLNKLIKF